MAGDPNCPICGGVGYLRQDVPLGDEKFGRLVPCVCRGDRIVENARQRLYDLSNLQRLSHLTFENFSPTGNPQAAFLAPQEKKSLDEALAACQQYAELQDGWLLIEGAYGCGKTHLAAAIANSAAGRGTPTLFITVPDLLDSLRFAYNSTETTFEQRFEEIRNAALLVLDDFGTQNATPWAQEKLFQIINYRYINKQPTVITTNLVLDEIEARIRSRLQDSLFVKHLRITAPDFRRPKETSNPGISILPLPEIREMTFLNFETREDEIGQEVVTTVTTEKQDRFGNHFKDKEIIREKITRDHLDRLRKAVNAATNFAEDLDGWLILLGPSYSGKTHLAAAIGNHRLALGGQVLMIEVSGLLDYLRSTFRPNSDVSFDRRFYEISSTPLLILDGLNESGSNSSWAEDKLFQILNHRYNSRLPTVITSTLDPDSFARNYSSLWNRILDVEKCVVCRMDMPPYRRPPKARRGTAAGAPKRDRSK
jgi:DNA replication protein DnaC